MPLAFSLDLDTGAIDQQMQRPLGAPIEDVDGQGLLAAGQCAEVGHSPIETDQLQQALDEPGRLPQCHPEQHLHRQARLDGGITVSLLSATPACRRGVPAHLWVEPDRQRASALERFIIGWPVFGLVGRGRRSAHATQLPCWIHEMNPSQDLFNRAQFVVQYDFIPLQHADFRGSGTGLLQNRPKCCKLRKLGKIAIDRVNDMLC